MNNQFNAAYTFIIAIGVIVAILIIIYLARKYLKILPTLWSVLKLIFDYFYLILVPIPIVYLMYYYLFYNKDKAETFLFNSKELISDLKNLSFWFFTAGIFSASSKLLSNLVIFKNQFKKVIMSEEFDDLLARKLEIITFSHDNLNRLSNLDDVWRKVTLCKYEKSFPHLMPKLLKNLENELFEENNLSAYYKNFRMQVKFQLLENEILKVTENSSCTVVTNSVAPVEIIFFVTSSENDEGNIYTKIIPSKTKIDTVPFPENTFDNIEPLFENGSYIKKFSYTLQGKTEYLVERYIEMQQNLNEDRFYTFASTKIIDEFSLNLQFCDKLNITFSAVGNNVFIKDNIQFEGLAYINRDLMLPGEKFKVFAYEK